MCSATFRLDLLLQLRNPTISTVTALLAAAELEFACPIFVSGVTSIYGSIHLSVLSFFSHGLLAPAVSLLCYSAATLLAAELKSNVY